MIDISIIIVTFNNQTEIGSCLRSLQAALKNLRAQLIVIDNDSSDRSRDIVRTALEKFSGLHNGHINGHIIENPANFGFTRAVNQGLEIADGEFILLLNPDTEVHSDTIDA
ncbi:MAG: glycosyltransferase, partial [bacterium]|nr:glycosyltransferase [bacterium]